MGTFVVFWSVHLENNSQSLLESRHWGYSGEVAVCWNVWADGHWVATVTKKMYLAIAKRHGWMPFPESSSASRVNPQFCRTEKLIS